MREKYVLGWNRPLCEYAFIISLNGIPRLPSTSSTSIFLSLSSSSLPHLFDLPLSQSISFDLLLNQSISFDLPQKRGEKGREEERGEDEGR